MGGVNRKDPIFFSIYREISRSLFFQKRMFGMEFGTEIKPTCSNLELSRSSLMALMNTSSVMRDFATFCSLVNGSSTTSKVK